MYSDAAQWSDIRRLILEQGTPIRQVAQEHRISRKTVRKMIQHPFPVPYGKGGRVRAKLGPYTSLIQSLLQENTLLPRSARLSISAIFKRLRDEEGYTGTYRTMQDYIRSTTRSAGSIGQSAFDLLASVKQGQAEDFLFLVSKAERPVVLRDHAGPPPLEGGRAVSITHNSSDRVQARQAAFEWMHAVLQNKASHDALCREVGDVPGFERLLEHLYDGRLSNRNRAMVVLASRCGLSKSVICRFLRIDRKTGRRYLRIFEEGGEAALFARQTKSHRKFDNETIKQAIFSLLHQPPSNFGINRTTWIMADLVRVMKESGQPACSHVIRRIVKDAGYRWRKARVVLTSADPKYTEKLDRIHSILSGLRPDEAFFSIDEFGPFAVKMTSGRALCAPGEQYVVPQWQPSRGCLIVTAGLELSGNQITHFYSSKKNTTEMIRMMELLIDRYRDRQKLYLSWDCASWHISKRLQQRIEEHNATALSVGEPIVDTAPLPSGAQFLNVIESVFSGMARAIIHNSDYATLDDAKAALDRHFADRNEHFRHFPKKAGKKIWGKEREPAAFSNANNCKDPRYR